MSDAPRVSIVIPAFDRADLLPETLDSVARQTFSDWECIVVDDGSTDATPDVVREAAERDARFRLVQQHNSSAAAARNRGLAVARGEFVVFLDSDDLLAEDRLAWQVEALDRDPRTVLAYGETFQFLDGDVNRGSLYLADVREKPNGHAFEALLQCSSIYAPMVRTAAAREAGGFDKSLPSAEDWDMWLRIARLGELHFEPRIALYYRVHPGNKSRNTLRNYRCARRVAQKHLATVPLRDRMRLRRAVRRYFRRIYSRPLLQDAWSFTKSRDWPAARAVWRTLSRLSPRLVLASRSTLAHVGWALLPTRRPPLWRGPAARAREAVRP